MQLILSPVHHHLLHCCDPGLHGGLGLSLVVAHTVAEFVAQTVALVVAQSVALVMFHVGSVLITVVITLVVEFILLRYGYSSGKNRSNLDESGT